MGGRGRTAPLFQGARPRHLGARIAATTTRTLAKSSERGPQGPGPRCAAPAPPEARVWALFDGEGEEGGEGRRERRARMGRKKQVPKSDRWLRANPLPTTATNELIVSWVARYEQEVGSVDQVRRPSQNYVEGGSGWQCGVCDLCFPIPEPIEVHEPQVVRQFYTHSQACRVSWLQQRSRQAEMAEGGAAGGAEEEAADISEVPLTTQRTSPAGPRV